MTTRNVRTDILLDLLFDAHSCLVPVDVTKIKILDIFVTIEVDKPHLISTLTRDFEPGSRLALVSMIQFNLTLHAISDELLLKGGITAVAPQAMPLSKGEVLGCTVPRLPPKDEQKIDAIVYIGDGRFHLESSMIHSPETPAYKYGSYSRKFTIETYDHKETYAFRRSAIATAKHAKKVGLILGTLGRQGNVATLSRLQDAFKRAGTETVLVVLSEIFPDKPAQFDGVDCWVQVACPRLSIY
ncbi:hypothetical protein TRICI_002712 [Trichomonascus ciferrii]|uniref:2-(3-amino-3-carboxypropyl)histidine synthase subunit 1 n=1 Tax=Trichomonascus ciferrii TaxID=44093 RepID=A0A642VB21_9ASCO|nr:hypothetical protein TRICI_002712 [Trichomonascus ciferrii]